MIRPMNINDLPVVAKLEHQLFSSPWSEQAFESELEENPYGYYVVYDDHGVKGYLGLWIVDTTMQVTTLGVDPSVQRRGIARQLLNHMIDTAQAEGVSLITLEVRQSNTPAKTLYTSFGFRTVAVRKNYYTQPDEDADLMLYEVKQM